MLEFGLTGGIGSGKSTVSARLAERGATIIDADAIVRHLQRRGERVFDMMVERWGQPIVNDEGELDRAAVAAIVFADEEELTALNAIVHPAVAEETQRLVDEARSGEAARIAASVDGGVGSVDPSIVIHDNPLLVLPGGELFSSRDLDDWAGIVVVDTPEDLAVERVVASRGMDADDVRSRMAAQATRAERRAVADFIIDNSGGLDDLAAEIERCWQWMLTKKPSAT